jgi:FkbM family methyltransferase
MPPARDSRWAQWRRLRGHLQRALARRDGLVRYRLGNALLWLPASHELPRHLALHPGYGANLARLAVRALQKYSDLKLIDVGANVGDTVALLRGQAHFPILCIEGDPRFFELLRRNAEALGPDLYLENSFLGEHRGTIAATTARERGSARIVRGGASEDGGLAVERLPDVLQRHPAFRSARLLKVDTDGFDVAVLRGALDFIAERRPLLFFEYCPYQTEQAGVSAPLEVFRDLRERGYGRVLAYDNTGDFLLSFDLGEERLLEDLHAHFTGRQGKRYLDMAVLAEEDADLWTELRAAEIQRASERGTARRRPGGPTSG